MLFNNKDTYFHHIGLATKHPEESFRFLLGGGYSIEVKGREEKQGVNIALLTHSILPSIEVIWDFSENSPIANFLKTQDSNCYHICFATNDYKNTMKYLEENSRAILISPLTPSTLMENTSVSFHYVKGIGLVELLYHTQGQGQVEK